jgi:hypothetical protein
MGHGLGTTYVTTMVSGNTSTTEVALGRVYEAVYLAIPSMTSQTQIHVTVCDVSGGTYRRVVHPLINTTTAAAPPDFTIVSSVTNRVVPIPNGFKFMKIETTMAVVDGCSFKIICAD